jgi:hypothetical protein
MRRKTAIQNKNQYIKLDKVFQAKFKTYFSDEYFCMSQVCYLLIL